MTLQVVDSPPVVRELRPSPVPVQLAPAPAEPGQEPTPAAPEPAAVTLGQMAAWVAQVAAAAGDPLSLTLTDATRQVHVHVGTMDDFRAWADALHTDKPRRSRDQLLGPALRAGVQVGGWQIQVNLFGQAVAA